jgi:hypothetical protein
MKRMVIKHRYKLRERSHTFAVANLFESSSMLDALALGHGFFDTGCDTRPALDLSLSLASRELNSFSKSPGCIPSADADELILKMDSRQSLATSSASGSAPGASSTALQAQM